jgi:hypothetical protein
MPRYLTLGYFLLEDPLLLAIYHNESSWGDLSCDLPCDLPCDLSCDLLCDTHDFCMELPIGLVD